MRKINHFLLIIIICIGILGCSASPERQWIKAINDADIDKINQLISEGQDVDAVVFNNKELTALYHSDNIDVCKVLMQNGADVNYIDKMETMGSLYLDQIENNIDKAKLIIENGFNINYQDEFGYGAISSIDNIDTLKLFLENGADVDIRNEHDETPLMLDAYASPEKVKLLIEYGADVNAYRTGERNNVLREVYGTYKYNKEKNDEEASKERLEVIRILVENGARIYDYTDEDTIKEAKQIPNVDDELIELLTMAKHGANTGKKMLTNVNLSNEEKVKIEQLLTEQVVIKNDDMSGITWYIPKDDKENYKRYDFRIYMGEKEEKLWLRLVAGFHHRQDWIFFEKIILKADEELLNIQFDDYKEKHDDTLSGGYVREIVDMHIDEELLEKMYEVVKTQNVKIRLQGRDEYLDYEINKQQLKNINTILDLYDFNKGYYYGLKEKYIN